LLRHVHKQLPGSHLDITSSQQQCAAGWHRAMMRAAAGYGWHGRCGLSAVAADALGIACYEVPLCMPNIQHRFDF
jgi:hypothetical protein